MDAEQLFLQLGIAGAVLFVGYRLFDKLIDHWAAGEKRKLAILAAAEVKRTKAIAEGFAAITTRLDDHGQQLAELHGKVDEHLSTKEAIKEALEEVTGQHELPLPAADQKLELAPPSPLAKVRTGATPIGGYHIQKPGRSGTKGGG